MSPVHAPTSQPGNTSQRFWGIWIRRERWGLSWRGWLIIASITLIAVLLLLSCIYPFLAVNHRVDSNILVVEGWVHEYAIRSGAEEFKTGSYKGVFTTGGPVVGSGGYINDYNTAASVGADLLKKAGVPAESLQMVPTRLIGRDRTYSSAIALREWFREHNMPVSSINILTESVHARRTRLLYKKVFGDGTTVGIIAVPNPDYDAKHWWRDSEGVKDVLSEAIAYLYARLLFYPSESSRR